MLISSLSASTSFAWILTSCTREVRSFRSVPGSLGCGAVCFALSDVSSACCRSKRLATFSSAAVDFSVASLSDCLVLFSFCIHDCSACSCVASTFWMRTLSSSPGLLTPTLSMRSRSMTCPNLSSCTSRARAPSSRSRSPLVFCSRCSCTCSVRSAFCRLRSAAFSSANSAMRAPRRSSSLDGRMRSEVRSAGSRPSARWRTCDICSVTTTSSSFSLPCFSVWNDWMSTSVSLSALSMIFSFLISASFSFLSPSTLFWKSA